jgi:molybdopterin synthase sulfur carrier subunit
MKINVLAFGIAKDIFGGASIQIELKDAEVAGLKQVLEERYPKLKQIASYMVAVNNEYAGDGQALTELDEIAIIPPVSGG